MHVLYSLAILVFAVVASPWFLYQAIRYQKYIGSLMQRFGVLPVSLNLDGDESIWIHAVSVGEALVARSLLPALREQYPGLKIFVSTTTLTGQQIARTRLSNVDAVFFFRSICSRSSGGRSASSIRGCSSCSKRKSGRIFCVPAASPA